MKCLDISAGGELICPDPNVAPWLTEPLPVTGQELTTIAVFALALLAIGLWALLIALRMRR